VTSEYIAQLEERVLTLTRLLEVSSVLNSALLQSEVQVASLLSYLMDAAAGITHSEAASVLLWNDQTQELYFAATTTSNKDTKNLIGKPVPLDSIAGSVIQTRSIVQVDDAPSDPRHYNKVDEDIAFQTRSLLGVPMIAREKVIGVLEVVNKHELPWTMADRNNLTTLASEAAVAIKVAQLMLNMQEVNEELSELDKLKSDFIAIASHELRTPLGIILGYASFLQDTDDASVSEHAGKVMDSALQLRRIIEDMINLRYLKQKPKDLQRHKVTLGDLITDLRRDVLTLTDTTHDMQFDVHDDQLELYVDSSRISMALVNVLNNATNFTPPPGKITLKTVLTDDNEVTVTITDSGIGIDEKEIDRIFEEFYQVEDHMTRRVGGLGIGLSISRALVEAHGGRIEVHSDGLGHGTAFTVTLPLANNDDLT